MTCSGGGLRSPKYRKGTTALPRDCGNETQHPVPVVSGGVFCVYCDASNEINSRLLAAATSNPPSPTNYLP
eukprot:1976874-Rhodomonas_salina.1